MSSLKKQRKLTGGKTEPSRRPVHRWCPGRFFFAVRSFRKKQPDRFSVKKVGKRLLTLIQLCIKIKYVKITNWRDA